MNVTLETCLAYNIKYFVDVIPTNWESEMLLHKRRFHEMEEVFLCKTAEPEMSVSAACEIYNLGHNSTRRNIFF